MREDLNSPCILLGDLNVNGRNPLMGLSNKNLLDPLRRHSNEYMNMIDIFHYYNLQEHDILFNEYGMHPITYGDVLSMDGHVLPKETVLTVSDDYKSMQRLDYIFLFEPLPIDDENNKPYNSSKDSVSSWSTVGRQQAGTSSPLTPSMLEQNGSKASSFKKKNVYDHNGQTLAFTNTQVEHFHVSDRDCPFSQLSDHYGVSTNLRLIL